MPERNRSSRSRAAEQQRSLRKTSYWQVNARNRVTRISGKIAGEPLLKGTYNMMMRKDDPAFKAVVDEAVAKLETSGEALKIFEKWFTQPIPPKNINLEFPATEDLKKLYAEPNDKALQ